MAEEVVLFEETVDLREFGAPGEVQRRRGWSWLGRPAFVPTHVRVTDRRVQVGDRTILLAHVSEVGLEHDEAETAHDKATHGGVWPWEPREAHADRVGSGVLRRVAGAVVMFWLFHALHYNTWSWAKGTYWAKLGAPMSMCLGVGLSLAALFRLLRHAYTQGALQALSLFGVLLLAISVVGFAVGDETAWVAFAISIPLLAIGIHVDAAEFRREVALFRKPTNALSITTGGTRTLTVESKERDAMHRLLKSIHRALRER